VGERLPRAAGAGIPAPEILGEDLIGGILVPLLGLGKPIPIGEGGGFGGSGHNDLQKNGLGKQLYHISLILSINIVLILKYY
jgi:hypothetical protein